MVREVAASDHPTDLCSPCASSLRIHQHKPWYHKSRCASSLVAFAPLSLLRGFFLPGVFVPSLGVIHLIVRLFCVVRQNPPCRCRHRRYLPIAEWPKSVHHSGHAINHAAWFGLYFPPASHLSRFANSMLMQVCCPSLRLKRPGCSHEISVSVGNNPDSFSSVRGANGGSSQHSPPCIKPHRGQVSKHGSESSKSEHWAVLHENESRSNLANDPGHFAPEARAFAVKSRPLSGAADVLARKPARNHVNNSAPRLSVKTAHVSPNWERFKASIVLPLCQNLCGVGITFNGAHGSPSEQLPSKYSSTSAREKSQLIHLFSVSTF